MRISEAAARTGTPARLLRYYEEQGLLHPARDPSGYRDYSEEDVAAAKRIRHLLAAGLSTATIAVVLPCLTEQGGGLDAAADLYARAARAATSVPERDHLTREAARVRHQTRG